MEALSVQCESDTAAVQAAKTRALCEMLAGLMRGCKFWPNETLNRLWAWLSSCLQRAFESINVVDMSLWSSCFHFSVFDRDPRRLLVAATCFYGYEYFHPPTIVIAHQLPAVGSAADAPDGNQRRVKWFFGAVKVSCTLDPAA
jgi:hypothetical protein